MKAADSKPASSQASTAAASFSEEKIRTKADDIAGKIKKAVDENKAPEDWQAAVAEFRNFLEGASEADIQVLRDVAVSMGKDLNRVVDASKRLKENPRHFYPRLIAAIDAKVEKLEQERGASPRSEVRVPAVAREKVTPRNHADRMVRSIRKSVQPATVFVDAEDFASLSPAQKQEYFFVALSNKAIRLVVYNERGQVQDQDKVLNALLKLNNVTSTGKDLAGAQISFDRSNAPSIHLSKRILPSQELVQRLRKRVSFFKTEGQNGGTLAAALLWAWSGGEETMLREISQGRDGFWIVAETLVNALQRSYDTTLAFAVAA